MLRLFISFPAFALWLALMAVVSLLRACLQRDSFWPGPCRLLLRWRQLLPRPWECSRRGLFCCLIFSAWTLSQAFLPCIPRLSFPSFFCKYGELHRASFEWQNHPRCLRWAQLNHDVSPFIETYFLYRFSVIYFRIPPPVFMQETGL